MEKFSQFRDRASGIAPFLPIPTSPAGYYLPLRVFYFSVRLCLVLSLLASYFLVLQWAPIGQAGRKASLWCILLASGLWWIDLQVDGVRKGSLSKQHQARLPGPNSIIASSFTSPVDALYLAAVFDPIFTIAYPHTRQVEHISLLQAILRPFFAPRETPAPGTPTVDLATLLDRYPGRSILTFPECTTTNGRGILPLSPALLCVPPKTKIFPVSVRYTPADIVTPVPGDPVGFLWALFGSSTHAIRVRIAEGVVRGGGSPARHSTYDTNLLDELAQKHAGGSSEEVVLRPGEKADLDHVADALARLGRVKRLGLGVRDKMEFVKMWDQRRKRW